MLQPLTTFFDHYVRDKMSCSIFNGQSMSLKWCVQILGLLWILSGNAEFVLSIKAQISRKKINLSKLFFMI